MKKISLLIVFGLASCATDTAREETKAEAARAIDSWSGAKVNDVIGVLGWPNGGMEAATAESGGMALWYEPSSRISCADKYPVLEIYQAKCQFRRPDDNRLCKDPYTDANAEARNACEAKRRQTGRSDYGCVIVARFDKDLTITRIDPPKTCSTAFYERLIDRNGRRIESAPREESSTH